jgi:hypothetical protein
MEARAIFLMRVSPRAAIGLAFCGLLHAAKSIGRQATRGLSAILIIWCGAINAYDFTTASRQTTARR